MNVCIETFAVLVKFMTSVNWSSVRQKSGMARDKKSSRWHNGWVVQKSLGVYLCQRRALWAFSM